MILETDEVLEAIEDSLDGMDRCRWELVIRDDGPAEPISELARFRIALDKGTIRYPGIDHILLIVPTGFPFERLQIVIPQLNDDIVWPHVENENRLCLTPPPLGISIDDCVRLALSDAFGILNLSEYEQCEELYREFASYWNRQACSTQHNVFSLVTLDSNSRSVVWCQGDSASAFIFADDIESLGRWQRPYIRDAIKTGKVYRTSYTHLPKPLLPSEYPNTGARVLELVKQGLSTAPDLTQSRRVPVLFSTDTETGRVAFSCLIKHEGFPKIVRKFGKKRRGLNRALCKGIGNRSIERYSVDRIDGSWIHGRDHNEDYFRLQKMQIAIVGCGSLGSLIATQLVQAGIGEFVFIDNDKLAPANLSRHALNAVFLNSNKAKALKDSFIHGYPHRSCDSAFDCRWQSLDAEALESVAGCDLLITAGLPAETEHLIARWRASIKAPLPQVSTWVEPFALAGHAVALFGRHALTDRMNRSGDVDFRITHWSPQTNTTLVEAGCGNVFQPHGVVDLASTVSMASALSLDVVLERVTQSLRVVFHRPLADITARGGQFIGPRLSQGGVYRSNWI